MKRQPFFPQRVGDRAEWFHNYATELPLVAAALDLDADAVTDTVADALYLKYLTGNWLGKVREFGPACTLSLNVAFDGPGPDPFAPPVFTPPALPTGVTAVASGALQRIFLFVQTIKSSQTYTEAIGSQLRIVGEEDTAEHPVPTFTLKVERAGDGPEVVRVNFRKYGRPGVAIYSRRGTSDWELLAIDLNSPYMDNRPLLVATQPETREYRLQYYEAEAPVGDFTTIASVKVGP